MPDYAGDFEVHLTVRTPDYATLRRFRDWCTLRGCKCVRIILARGQHPDQPMASWRRTRATLSGVEREAEAYVTELGAAGVVVVRLKVEASMQNADVPIEDADAGAPGTYFEHHVKLLRDADAPTQELTHVCEPFGAHLSRNAFRELPTGKEERFVTLRTYGTGRLSSERQLQQLLAALSALGETMIDCESEYCVRDSNLNLDAGWLRQVLP